MNEKGSLLRFAQRGAAAVGRQEMCQNIRPKEIRSAERKTKKHTEGEMK